MLFRAELLITHHMTDRADTIGLMFFTPVTRDINEPGCKSIGLTIAFLENQPYSAAERTGYGCSGKEFDSGFNTFLTPQETGILNPFAYNKSDRSLNDRSVWYTETMEAQRRHNRLALPKTALPRLFFIDREIASGGYPSSSQLAEKYETSVSSIGRDISFMKYSLDAPIEYCAKNRGFYYSVPNYRIPAGFSRAEDLLALGMAKNILSLYQDTPLYEAAYKLLAGITAPLAAEGNKDWYENRIIVPPVASAPIVPEVWKAITAGLKENRILTFDYQGTWGGDFKSRRIRPYQLLFDTGVWYLYGFSEERKAIRVFSLPRIKNITITKDHFSLPQNFDYRTRTNDSYFGVFAGQEKIKFCIGFYDESVMWVQERKWAEDQEIEETDDGVVITFTSPQYQKVLEWVLSRGCTAQPFAPENLVKDWQRHISEMGKLVKCKKELL